MAVRGYLAGFAEGDAPPAPPPPDPAPLLSTVAFDSNGTARLIDDDIQSMTFDDVNQTLFANPDREYTGFAADGFWYTAGELDPSHVPFKASWAVEGESAPTADRSDLDRFPTRILVVTTRKEIAIFDSDSLDLWMRFRLRQVVPVSPTVIGPLLGIPTTKVRTVAFRDGLMFVATNQGLRVVNFREDVGFRLTQGATDNLDVGTGIVDRNDGNYLGTTLTAPLRRLVDDDCLTLSAETKSVPDTPTSTRNSFTVCAVGHANGISAFQVTAGVVTVERHVFEITYSLPWTVEDDLDADPSTPFFLDSVSAWDGDGISPGDELTTDIGTTHTIVEVDQISAGNRLVLDPELGVGQSGASYVIRRSVTAVLVDDDARLFFASGARKVTVVPNNDWFDGGTIFSPSSFVTSNPTAGLLAPSPRTNDLALGGDLLYIATDIGVFRVSETDFSEQRDTEFLYSTVAVTEAEATFKILVGDEKVCTAVAVDPETGNVSVAVTELLSTVTEINPNIHQAFRFFSTVGKVRSILTYRNAQGPPDEAVT
jgi:hypothetical protein